MKKRYLTLTMATLMLAASLSGCGAGGEETSSDTTANSSVEEKTEATATGEKTKVHIWTTTYTTDEQKQAFIDAFNQSEASKNIEVVFCEEPGGTSKEKDDALLTNLIGGGEIDIFDSNQVQYYNFASKGMYENLTPYIEADKYDASPLGETAVENSLINDSLYGLPYKQTRWVVYYNKDLFDAAGLPYPSDDWTWDEFRETAKALTKGEGADKQWGFTAPDWTCTWAGIAAQKGVPFVKEDGTSNLDDPAFREALQFKYDLTMVDKSGPSRAENVATQANYAKSFSAGNIGMLIAGNWVPDQIKTTLNGNYTFEYDIAELPHPEGVQAGTTFGATEYAGINSKRSEEQKKAAWEVLKFMASPENGVVLAKDAGRLPSVYTEEIEKAYLSALPEFVTNGDVIFDTYKRMDEKPAHVAGGQIDLVMTEEADMFLTDSQDLDTTMENMYRRSNEEIQIMNESLE